ncbi:hypothetical protein Sme01_72560 [Sphaerisporangium melleum]|uniref:Subtilisin inhibitor domain-containing protein n=1 Tax=Sphaerisporangium melleum TaxID=321316 RepID=A0A917RQF5_9ACTN|nr:SSI family serine proteinase inhibitor [Sphaerisporangium melleum]GGL18392.1 hypothetical protein GCM10007964_70530 [Sphaerisporangium melleum]GII74780.1 hypothetical protein Sme01_72560 [Sphaerisporangium melleum]
MRRLTLGLTCTVLLLGVVAALSPLPTTERDAAAPGHLSERPATHLLSGLLPAEAYREAPGEPGLHAPDGETRPGPIPGHPDSVFGYSEFVFGETHPGPVRAHEEVQEPAAGTTGRQSPPGVPRPGETARPAPAKNVSRVLLLTVARGESPTPADKAVLLQCGPPAGSHPKAAEACRQLEGVGGDLNELHVAPDTKCTREYDPVTVFGAGLWDRSRLSYERTFGNRCELKATTGAVFTF